MAEDGGDPDLDTHPRGAEGRHPDLGPDGRTVAHGRFTIAALTDVGYKVVVAAAPTHVRAVRHPGGPRRAPPQPSSLAIQTSAYGPSVKAGTSR